MISLIVLAIVSVVLGIQPTIYMLQIPVALILLLLLSYGFGMILSTIGVFFRDMEYLWSVALMIIMYTCAIFYYPSKLLKVDFHGYWNSILCIVRSAFSFRYVWRDDEYALFCICTGIQCSVDSDRNDLFQKRSRMNLYFIYNCGSTGEKNGKTGSCSRQCEYEI